MGPKRRTSPIAPGGGTGRSITASSDTVSWSKPSRNKDDCSPSTAISAMKRRTAAATMTKTMRRRMTATERMHLSTERMMTATERMMTATEQMMTATERMMTATEQMMTATE